MTLTDRRTIIGALNLVPLFLLSSACLFSPVEDRAAAEPAYYTPPARIVVMFDKTGSVGENRVEQPNAEDLDLLFEVLSRVSGELAIGSISDDSNRTLLRLRIDLPPAQPEAPSDETNAYILADLRDEYDDAMVEYQKKLDAWTSATRSRIDTYRDRAAALLSAPANARYTDIWGAVRRAKSFLDEPTPSWGETSRFVVLISDGDDNVRGDQVEPGHGTHVAIVNGAAMLGDLGHLDPVQFESVDAAFRWVVAMVEASTVVIEGA